MDVLPHMSAQMFGDRDNVPSVDHQRLAGLRTMRLPDTACIDRNRGPEAVADHANILAIHIILLGEPGHRIPDVLHLVLTHHTHRFTFAVSATTKVEAHCDIAPIGEHVRDNLQRRSVFAGSKTVQHEKRRTLRAGCQIGGSMDNPCKRQSIRLKRNLLFHGSLSRAWSWL